MYEDLHETVRNASIRRILLVGGDFNAEVFALEGQEPSRVLGTHVKHARQTAQGTRLLDHCQDDGLRVAETFTAQADKTTWYKPYHGTWHAIDHALMRWCDSRLHARTIVIHDEVATRGGIRAWGNYSDHRPLETTLKEGWAWARQDTQLKKDTRRRPNLY